MRGPAEQTETRVSTVVGDRLCTGCGYNLAGQPVVREPHYALLIARCPECGVVASLQEYPLLGRWVGRWAVALAAMWFAFVLALLFTSAGILMACVETAAHRSAHRFATFLSQRQLDDLTAQQTFSQPQEWILQQGAGPHTTILGDWLAGQDLDALLGEAGGRWAMIDQAAFRQWGWTTTAALVLGCIWAVVLLHVRRRWLPVFGLIPLGLTAVFVAISEASDPGAGWLTAHDLARSVIGAPFAWGTLAFSFVPLTAGLLLGRPAVRLLVRLLLPPRLRGGLAILWTAEGLDPPRRLSSDSPAARPRRSAG